MDLLKVKRIDLLTFGTPLLVILASTFVALSSLTKTHPEVTSLLAYDLAVLSPLLYFFLIRKRKISKLTVIPFVTVGIILTTILLPENQHNHLNIIKAIVIPALEIFLLVTILRKAYLISKRLKANSQTAADTYSIIKKSCIEAFGKGRFINFLIAEMAVLYYGLFAWKKRKVRKNEFTNYKDNGTKPLLWGLIFIMLIETVVLHFLLAKWSFIAAWVLTALSIYTVLMVFAHLKALLKRPSRIEKNKVILINGLLSSIEIDIAQIKKVEFHSKEISTADELTGNLGLTKESKNHNVAIYFSETQTVEKFYGLNQKCEMLVFYIDDKNKFVEKVNSKIA